MSSREGVQRIKLVGKLISLIGSTITVLIWLLLFAAHGNLVELLMMLITPVAFGGLVYALGWILEGYNEPPRPDDEL